MPKRITEPCDVDIVQCTSYPVGSAYRLLRLITGLSVNRFANRIQISSTYWNDLETGKKKNPSQEVKERVAQICGLSIKTVEYLLDEENNDCDDIYQEMIRSIDNYVKQTRLDKYPG